MEKGNIVILNGVSSSGKTTLARALQERLEEPYFLLSSDMFQRDMVPDKFTNYQDIRYNHAVHLNLFLTAMSAFHQTIRQFSDMGLHTVVDAVFLERHKTFDECIGLLRDYPVLFVHVTCPLEELRCREKERGDRFVGQAEEQLSQLYPRETYDVIVDTHNNPKDEYVGKIIALLNYPEAFTAFRKHWSRRRE